jgi:hypothetical protein
VWYLKDVYWGFKLMASIATLLLTGFALYYRKIFFQHLILMSAYLSKKFKDIS